ncbi:MAG: chromosome segregation protein SMC [Chloroflexi bacterium GWB2_49_20]|nr:MAG: chromosome segregation protein SMC [Chloroflexi bacterium GWB2_49_20]OGN78261.1 MAG: chromosome segregation protein SMC [Chloroflexi bacterium GWC2_49_37]OGN85297.1 MAG: chromosome segregation protein SMC [Chloroflexi bacterium GWD2_49_16]
MPLRLKSLELHGYKTFASRTKFEFSDGVTAIVGPNGSGKSNIADALRWVLGEQSYSLLRGKKTEDMIFSGSENRQRAGMASASIIFDNTDDWLPVDFSEVELERHAYRDGRNDYLLNGQHVRLREIYELLAQSGLSERTYTILGQGLVDASLALKADERRRLFEEAAGIGLYRSRREEALKRLDTTRRNLDRVLDILAELGPRLRSLEKQARRSQEYLQVQADLRASLREWYGYHWYHSQREMNESRDLAISHDAKLKDVREAHLGIRQDFSEFRDRLQSLRSRLTSWHRESARLHSNRETISRDMAVLEERRRSLSDNRQNALLEQGRLEVELGVSRDRLVESERETEHLQQEYDESGLQAKTAQENLKNRQIERNQVEVLLGKLNEEISAANTSRVQLIARQEELITRVEGHQNKLNTINETISATDDDVSQTEENHIKSVIDREQVEESLAAIENKLAASKLILQELESARITRVDERTEFTTEATKLKMQLEVLDQAEQSLTGFADGARLILESARKSKVNAGIQALSSSLDVPAELEMAIAASLGEFVDSVIFQSDSDIEEAINLLEVANAGRATMLPTHRLVFSDQIKAPQDPDCLGLACDMVKIIPEYRVVVDYLLGRVLIVKNRKAAKRLINGIQKDLKVVTLSGEIFYASGPVQAGKQANTGILGRKRQKREYLEGLSRIEHQIEQASTTIQEIEHKVDAIQDELNNHNISYQRILGQLELARSVERKAREEYESAKRKHDWHISQRVSLEEEIESANGHLQTIVQEAIKIDEEIKKFQETARFQANLLSGLNITEFSEQLTYWNTQLAVAVRALSDAQNRKAERLQILSGLEDQKDTLLKKLSEYENSIAFLDTEKLNLRERENELNKQLESLRILIEPAEADLENAELQETDLQQQEIKRQQALASAERYYNQVQLDFGRKQEAVESLRQKIEDDFGLVSLEYATNVDGPVPLPLNGMVEQLVFVDKLSDDLEETLSRQRMLLRRMGPINPEAQQEFESVSERHKFLESQLEDLRKAEIDIRQVISELDEITRQEFLKTFSAVADEFKIIFHRLFGGGSARLLLTDPDNLNETGIDIEARLPGKREQGLALLSGGERSLTAIALVFSLLKVSPTPVCVMDEVDAMLDEANVGRFRDLVSELSNVTQFIIITHNRNTVQAADVIYGVTMGRDSVSQIISLKLDEVSDELLRGRGV